MRFLSRIPLAWLNLTHRPMRFLVFLAGIGFAVVLMFVQLGFWCALLDGVVALIDRMNADLVIVNRAKYALEIYEPFPHRHVAQARGVAGVESVTPLYIGDAMWKIPDMARPTDPQDEPLPTRQVIRVLAFDPSSGALRAPEAVEYARHLGKRNTALRDRLSKSIFGMKPDDFSTELNEQNIKIIGTFELGTDFSTNGNLIMSDYNYAQYFKGMTASASPLDDVEVGLVRLQKGADPLVVRQALEQQLPDDVRVCTLEEYKQAERDFWQNSTPIGFIFLLGLVVGFVVGVIICSQILSTDVGDHLSEYATLKAIGYTNGYLTGVVLKEALLLSLLGFLPGLAMSKLIYVFLGWLTGLPMDMTFWRSLAVLGFTVAMCIISGFLALGKVWVADPAEVF
jgi:putative ABC transport system permease protein